MIPYLTLRTAMPVARRYYYISRKVLISTAPAQSGRVGLGWRWCGRDGTGRDPLSHPSPAMDVAS